MTMTYFQYTRTEILPLIPAKTERILEIGCGAGNTLQWLKVLKGSQWVGGVEIAKDAIVEAKNKLDAVYEGNI